MFSQFKGEDMAGEGKIRMAEELRRVETNLIFTAKGTKLNINSKYCLRLVVIQCYLKRCANELSFAMFTETICLNCKICSGQALFDISLTIEVEAFQFPVNNLVHSQHLKLSITYWNKQAVFIKDLNLTETIQKGSFNRLDSYFKGRQGMSTV